MNACPQQSGFSEKSKIMSKIKSKNHFSPFVKQSFVTAAVGFNIIGHGCTLGYPAVLLPQLSSPSSNIHLDQDSVSWIVSIVGIMQLVGSFTTPSIMSRYGRRIAHFAVLTPMLVGWFVTISATGFMTLFVGRVLHGLSIGMLAPLRSVLIGEYSSPKYRGAFLTTVSLTQSFGLFFVHLVGSFMSWQQTALVCVFFSFFSLVMTIYSPESPSWLASKGRYEECRDVFHWLRGDEEDKELEELIQARLMFDREQILHKSRKKVNHFDDMLTTIKKKEFYKPIILMMHAYVMVNFAGGTTMATYATVIIAMLMGPDVNVHFWMIFLDTQRLVSNFLAVFIVNKVKRRTMMFTTGGLSIFSQFALAAYVYCKQHNMLYYDALWIPALLINLKFFTVATGMLPLPNVIGGEVFPLEYRNIGASISLASLSITFFLVLKTFTGLVENFGLHGSYVVYGVILSYCMFIIWLLLPETKGKTLQEIEDEFRGRPLVQEELEARQSIYSNPDNELKRKMSILSVQ